MKNILNRILQSVWPGRRLAPANDTSYDPIEALREYVQRDVASGFYDRSQILRQAEEAFEDELDSPLLKVEATAALETALAAYWADQQTWPAITDCDRLDSAFNELEVQGIVARQNFSCCGTCGSAEIWDEADALEAKGKKIRGYAFYHMQDTESAAGGNGLYLNYGAVDDGEEAALKIGNEIVRELGRQGLKIDWNGSWSKRIGVSLDWKRRNPACSRPTRH